MVNKNEKMNISPDCTAVF